MSTIKNYILKQVAEKKLNQDEAKQLLLELAKAGATETPDKSIAIIGMSGRFPQADNAEQFWEKLRDGINCIGDYPIERRRDIEHVVRNPYYLEYLTGNALTLKDLDDVFAPAGYMKDVDKFDAAFFGIPPNEATHMDPNQRMALEIAWEAMEDAGYGGESLFGTNTGVYIGREGTNVAFYRFNSKKDPMQLTGSWESIIASRISYLFNLRGPSMLVDTACSSSLVSVHMACKAILSGECNMALAGGVNLVHGELKSRYQGGMNMSSVESEDNVIRTFDANANGTVWGEGVAMVLLKPLQKALADGDHIHAIIKGSAINNDGASNALTAPNAETQEEVIVKAWQDAGINPESLSYVEAHGTGTVLGDPIEFKALTNAFRRFTNRNQFCAIGSLKTNMGHLVASSGAASLFKVVKSMEHKELAPTINFSQPNPYINFAASPLYVADRHQPWTLAEGNRRRAGISSFGFNHTNCHMVVEEAPARHTHPAVQPQYCLTISARKQSVLRDYLARYQAYCRGDNWNLADLCYTAAVGRGHYNHRLCIVADSEQQLRARLKLADLVIDGGRSEGICYGGFTIVSDKKTQRAPGEITEREKKAYSDQAKQLLGNYISNYEASALNQLAEAYCQGGDVQWSHCYEGEKRTRLAQPVYPLERVRLWAEPKISQVEGFSAKLHPLVDALVTQGKDEWLFESTFSNETHWVLADHKIKDTGVVPGTTYLEMARVVAREALGLVQMELADLFFLQPMVVEPEEKRLVRMKLVKKHPNEFSFSISSSTKSAADSQWQTHVEGKIRTLDELNDEVTTDTSYLAVQQNAEHFIEEYMAEADTGVFQFGPHWDTVRAAWNRGNQALARLVIPAGLQTELGDFVIHPSMLDNAMNLTSQTTGHTYLPFMYKSFRLYRPFTAQMYSLVTATSPMTGEEETHNYNVVMTDLDGNVIARAEGYVTKKVHSFDFNQGGAAVNDYLGIRWVDFSVSDQSAPAPGGALLVISSSAINSQDDQASSVAPVLESLRQRGIEVRHATLVPNEGMEAVESGTRFIASAEGLAQLVASDHAKGIAGILVATDFAPTPFDYALDAARFAARRQITVDALFHLGKSLLDSKVKLPWGLALLSSHGYRVASDEVPTNPLAAASAILGLTLAMETASLQCRVLDTDIAADADDVIAKLLQLPAGQIFAYRGAALFQQELAPVSLPKKPTLPYRADGVYVITGGLGGLGLAAAAHLASAKANVVLLGRSALPEQSQWDSFAAKTDNSREALACASLVTLRAQLGSLDYRQVDVSDATQVVALVANLRAVFARINGVFHAAGIAGDGFILRKSFATFDAVLQPKLQGTVNLLAALGAGAGEAPDFITLYSSITGLVGGEGQSDYAAANAFMDAVVAIANSNNLPVNSINWPSWSEVGMSVDFELDTDMTPFSSLTTAEAFRKFDQILANNVDRILPADINPPVFTHVRDQLVFELAPELELKFREAIPGAGEGLDGVTSNIQILGKSEDELTETESTLATIYATVLGISEIDIFTNFQDMGGNSIIATHLLKVIENQYPSLIDISDIFSYPSIDVLGEYIDGKRGMDANRSRREIAVAEGESGRDWSQLMDSLTEGEASIDSILEKI